MKKHLIILILISIMSQLSLNAQINGTIVPNSQLTTIKVWGTNYQMGYAYGYHLGESINNLIRDYLKPQFGNKYAMARSFVTSQNNLVISADIILEMDGIIDAMNATGTNTDNIDRLDLIIANSFIDISAFSIKGGLKMGCSALMSWGDATAGGFLDGKSIVTRHLDWSLNQYLLNSMVLCVHLPQESGKRPWMGLSFSGGIGALSAMNSDMAVFQNMMDDYNGAFPQADNSYTPIWLSLRKVIETDDLNGDGHNNTADLRHEIDQQPNGYAPGVMLYAMARSTESSDNLIALIAEIAPTTPKVTYRDNSFPDSIPGNNLYLANEQIKRNNEYNFSSRYNGIRNAMSSSPTIDTTNSWNFMKDYSHLNGNIMMMQYAPEADLFRLSVYDNKPAYQVIPKRYSLDNLLSNSGSLSISNTLNDAEAIYIYPNPATKFVCVNIVNPTIANKIKIMDITGKIIIQKESQEKEVEMISLENLASGTYIVVIENSKGRITKKFVKQ